MIPKGRGRPRKAAHGLEAKILERAKGNFAREEPLIRFNCELPAELHQRVKVYAAEQNLSMRSLSIALFGLLLDLKDQSDS